MPPKTEQEIWTLLDSIKDPEIPVVSVVEMGMVRAVVLNSDQVIIQMTPTFSGCPALQMIQENIRQRLLASGVPKVQIEMTLSPAWTSDWITPAARRKLQGFGIAPPIQAADRQENQPTELQQVVCPYCGSERTRLTNSFGPSLCRAIYVCDDCRQPFEQFKTI